MAPTRLEFGLLGPLEMSVDGVTVSLGGPKQRVVLAILLMSRNRPVAVDSLIAAAWGEESSAEGRTNIHVYISNLRKLLTAAGLDGRAVLAKQPPGYRLNIDDANVDVGRFARHKESGLQAASTRNFEDASRQLSAALAQWRGPVLEDLQHFDFVEPYAVALTEEKVAAHAARAQAEIACGRTDATIGELEALVVEHPFREPMWAQLITAYYLVGRQSDALDAYQRLKDTLADELGIDPNEALRELHGQILRQESLDVQQAAQETAFEAITNAVRRMTDDAETGFVACLSAESGERFPVNGAATSIGRLSENDIVLSDTKVSRRHAMIVYTGVSFVIHDTGSANGVELEGKRITGSAPLGNGDHLRIGDMEFTFELRSEDG